MKRFISAIVVLVMMAALFTLCAGAADIDRNVVYQAAYGAPVLDGKMDDIYLLSDEMYAENGIFTGSATVKEGQFATAKYRLVWNQKSLYIFCEVTDPTRSDPGASNASATKMDNCDIYVICDPAFSTDKDYSDRSVESSGQFRYHPGCTIEEEPARAASWGGLTVLNQMFGSPNYVGDYKDQTTGDYSFEMQIDFNPAYAEVLAANLTSRTDTLLGFALQINDVMDNDAKRDAYVFSNNATEGLSKNLANCGAVSLYLQAGAEIIEIEDTDVPDDTTAPADTTPADTTPADTTTSAPSDTTTPAPADTTTPAPADTTTPKSADTTSSDKGGCGSVVASGLLAIMVCAAVPALVRVNVRKKD